MALRYPGHIAKAERQLQEYLKMVDVVIEVRDCRIPSSTTHQLVPSWVGKRYQTYSNHSNLFFILLQKKIPRKFHCEYRLL